MSVEFVEKEVVTGLKQLKIDDSRVNKMRRRRSARIQQRIEQNNRSFDFNFDLANNNLPDICPKVITKANKSENEFELELENVHYQRAMHLFQYITNSICLVRQKKKIDDDDDAIVCDCTLTTIQINRGVLGCTKNCLNRVMSIECNERCVLGSYCGNKQFQKQQNARCTVFITEKKGYGLFASTYIPKNTFIMEFVGEIVSMSEFKKRSKEYAKQNIRHCYVMSETKNNLIDATQKGNLTRFVNHSCDPNAETQKWTVNGKCRIGIFSKRNLKAFEEITINYQFERFGKDAQKCYCEASNCRGWIGI